MGKPKPLPEGVDKKILLKIAALRAKYSGYYLMQRLYDLAFLETSSPSIAEVQSNKSLCAELQKNGIMNADKDITDPNVRAVLKAAVYESDQPSADPKNPFAYPSIRIESWCHGYLGAAAKKLNPVPPRRSRAR